MTKDAETRRARRQGASAPKQFVMLVTSFVVGYFVAAIIDLETLTHWINTQVLAKHDSQKAAIIRPASQQAKTDLPKPKFEFYTLLANPKGVAAQSAAASAALSHRTSSSSTSPVQVASHNAAVQTAATTQNVANKNPSTGPTTPSAPLAASTNNAQKQAYQIQVASFRARKDAEQMKGLLTLKGYEVYIVPITSANKENWFRVVVGPYATRDLAQRVQTSLAQKERLRGMVSSVGG